MSVVQRTPNLGVGIRLQRLAAPQATQSGAADPAPSPGDGCGCEATGVMWLLQPSYYADEWGGYGWDIPWVDAGAITGIDEYGGFIIDWDTPTGADFVRITAPWPDRPPTVLVAGASGPQTRGVQWSVDRSGHPFDIGFDLQSMAIITVQPFEGGSGALYETITLTARCGDVVVGTLRLQVSWEGAQ